MRLLLSLLCVLLLVCNVQAQRSVPVSDSTTTIRVVRPTWKPKLMPGVAYSFAVINNRRELKGLYKPGINAQLFYLHRPWFGVSGEYTYHFEHPSAPGIDAIRAWNADLNGNLLMKIGESDLYFNAIFGVGYMKWQGTYVGPNSAFNDLNNYTIGMPIRQEWISANLGCGFSHSFGKHLVGFGTFKVRFASENVDLFSISDTAFQFGIRADLSKKEKEKPKTEVQEPKGPRTIKMTERGPNYKGKRKGGKQKSSKIYKWLKKRR